MAVKLRIAFKQVICAHDGGVATDIATAQIALLKHGDIRDAMIFGEVIGGCQTVAATANDNHVILRFWRRIAPRARP